MPDQLCRVSVEELEHDRRQMERENPAPSPEDLADSHYDEYREMQDEQ